MLFHFLDSPFSITQGHSTKRTIRGDHQRAPWKLAVCTCSNASVTPVLNLWLPCCLSIVQHSKIYVLDRPHGPQPCAPAAWPSVSVPPRTLSPLTAILRSTVPALPMWRSYLTTPCLLVNRSFEYGVLVRGLQKHRVVGTQMYSTGRPI